VIYVCTACTCARATLLFHRVLSLHALLFHAQYPRLCRRGHSHRAHSHIHSPCCSALVRLGEEHSSCCIEPKLRFLQSTCLEIEMSISGVVGCGCGLHVELEVSMAQLSRQ